MSISDCKEQALRYLTMREHNRFELKTKLKTKGYEPETIDQVLDSLESVGYLSEERYVQSFIRSSNRRHPEGKAVILQRLAAKGADRSVARAVADEMYTYEYTLSLVREAAEKLDKKGKDRRELLKLGFSMSEIKEI